VEPGTPTFSEVWESSFTVSWDPRGNPGLYRYELSISTESDFQAEVSTPIVFAQGFIDTTTTFMGLPPSTTFYLRIRAENDDITPVITSFSVVGSTCTRDSLGAVPTGLNGSALSFNSIQWSWTSYPSAAYYRLYQATSSAWVQDNIGSNMTTENNLSTNTAYGRTVSAWVTGLAGQAFHRAPRSTRGRRAGDAELQRCRIDLFYRVTWTARGNPSNTPYEVVISTWSNFSMAVSSPISFAMDFTQNTTTFINRSPNQTYYVKVYAKNGTTM